MTQAQLDLARLGMMIARMQLKAMHATAIAMEKPTYGEGFLTYENALNELCLQIESGEIRGSDAGQA